VKSGGKRRYRQVKFYLDESEYDRLKSLADELGESPASLAKKIVLEYLGLSESASLLKRVCDLEEKYERLVRELGRVEREVAYLMRVVKSKRGS